MKTKRLIAAFSMLLIAGSAYAQLRRGALVLPVKPLGSITAEQALEPAASCWNGAAEVLLKLNLTPPLYVGDPVASGSPPPVIVQLLRQQDGTAILRARWKDATEDKAKQGTAYPDAGAAGVYKQHTENPDAFPDAFCVMVPVKRGPHATYPSIMMGESAQPVDLYYWKAGVGFQRLGAHGRASTADTGKPLEGKAARNGDQWVVTMVLPNLSPQTPVCFAVWDGARAQRDGLKYFSLWHEVE